MSPITFVIKATYPFSLSFSPFSHLSPPILVQSSTCSETLNIFGHHMASVVSQRLIPNSAKEKTTGRDLFGYK